MSDPILFTEEMLLNEIATLKAENKQLILIMGDAVKTFESMCNEENNAGWVMDDMKMCISKYAKSAEGGSNE